MAFEHSKNTQSFEKSFISDQQFLPLQTVFLFGLFLESISESSYNPTMHLP